MKDTIDFDDFQKLDIRVGEIISAPIANGTRKPCRQITVDLGEYGQKTSIGQYMLIDETDLIGMKVAVCCNLGKVRMGKYTSEVLILGTPHHKCPKGQSQAYPLVVHNLSINGSVVY